MKHVLLAAVAVLGCVTPAWAAMHETAIPPTVVSSVVYNGRQLDAVSVSIPAVAEPGAILSGLLELRMIPESGEDGPSEVQAAAFRDGDVVIPEGKTGPVAAYAFGESEAILQLDITPILRQSLAEGKSLETLLVGRIEADALGAGNVISLNETEGIWGRLILHLKEM